MLNGPSRPSARDPGDRCGSPRLRLLLLACLGLASGCVDRKAVAEGEPADAEGRDAVADGALVTDAAPEDAGLPWSEVPLPPITSPCPSQRDMVGLHFPDGACYLMDPWPVTRGAYHAALASGPLVSSHPECAGRSPAEGPRWREDWANDAGRFCSVSIHVVGGEQQVLDRRMPWPPSESEAQEPMVCVSWCDAHAYCERVGKRLCGNRGLQSSDAYETDLIENAELDELYNACTGGGTRRSPTGARVDSIGQNQLSEVEFRPLQRSQLEAAGEGAFRGIFGLRVGIERTGPIYSTLWSDRVDLDEPSNPYRECRVHSESLWRVARRNEPEHSFGGVGTFRCCADPEPFE